MNLELHKSIGSQLLRVVFGFYLIVTILVTCGQLYFEYFNTKSSVVSQLDSIVLSFEDRLRSALESLDAGAMESIVTGMNKLEIVSGVKLVGANSKIKSADGFYRDAQSGQQHRFKVIELDGIVSTEISVEVNGQWNTFYEYIFNIYNRDRTDTALSNITESISTPKVLGRVSLYAPQTAVVEAFKSSAYLILVNAVIKSVALGLILLFFSNRLLSKPFVQLANATRDFVSGQVESPKALQGLSAMAQKHNHNDLDLLASQFLSMRKNITEKMTIISALNQFALALTQAETQNKIYSDAVYLLQQVFTTKKAVVFDHHHQLAWQSQALIENDHSDLLQVLGLDNYELDVTRARRELRYFHHRLIQNSLENQESTAKKEAVLYIPFQCCENQPYEIWLIGQILPSRLTSDYTLTEDSLNCLQIFSNILSATLTKLNQKNVINTQNTYLEERVSERTEELLKVNEELRYLAVHDPLTSLPNRALFDDRLEHMLAMAIRENEMFAVVSIDLINFKKINDTFGHAAGDIVLQNVSRRFVNSLRDSDTLARMGGDEFAGIFIIDKAYSVHVVLDNLIAALEKPIEMNAFDSVTVSANIGISIFPDHAMDAKLLFKYADIAMYRAKNNGSHYAVFDEQQNEKEKKYLEFMFDLEHAVEKNQLVLNYQPIIDLKTGLPIGCEALVRWHHPEKGMIPPVEFIPIAERSDLIKSITFWVFEEACEQCSAWHRNGIEVGISINVSARIFTLKELPNFLKNTLKRNHLNPKWVKLEITETVAMSHPEQAMEAIAQFNEMGVSLSIDDFGTGHSSLAYLTQLPVQELKVDRSFISSYSESEENQENSMVAEAIIDLAHALGFFVVAEGIEAVEMLDVLRLKGCDAAQGYYICRPAEASVITEWLLERQQFLPSVQSSA